MYNSQADAIKEWLRAFRASEKKIDEQIMEIRELRSRIMGIGAQEITDMPRAASPKGDALTEYVIRLEALDARLSREMQAHEKERRAMIELLCKLPCEERDVMKCRYLFGYGWDDVMQTVYGGSADFFQRKDAYKRRMFRVRNRAVLRMAKMW